MPLVGPARGRAAAKTQVDYRWRLDHLLRYLARNATADIDVRRVDWLRAQLRDRGLAARSVNMVLDCLAQVLDDAVEYGLLDTNPARGKRRRMRLPQSRRTFLEPDQVVDLLDAAGRWERELLADERFADRVIRGRRALLATLCLAGPRIHELTAATRARLDVHGGRLRIGEAKTEAGLRDVELTAFLLDELRGHLAGVPAELRERRGPALPVFPTGTGGHHSDSNVRNRLLAGAVRRANEKRAAEGEMLLPERVTPHTLRRTFASLALAAGRDPRWVMAQLGHTDARFMLNVYAQVMQRQRIDKELICG
ncbi:MAG: site-specific integrase [Actinomycetota bacterium]|nr:site-specific integrase [Actinomycetota bacterium]